MRLAIVGSRTFCDYGWMEQCLLRSFSVADIELVISGGARGADSLAARFAYRYRLPFKVIQADWETYGRKAGPMRNTEIVRQADALAAFWDGRSAGTRDTIAKARAAGIRIVICPCEPPYDRPPAILADSAESVYFADSPVKKAVKEDRPLLFSDILFPVKNID